MKSKDPNTSFDIGHPAPGARRVGGFALVLGFSLGPLVWVLQLVAVSAISGVTCLAPDGAALAETAITWADPATRWINIGALVLGGVALAWSVLNLIRTWRSADVPAGGVLMAGEGRAHWMAVGGVFAALLFLSAIAFTSIAVFLDGLCPL